MSKELVHIFQLMLVPFIPNSTEHWVDMKPLFLSSAGSYMCCTSTLPLNYIPSPDIKLFSMQIVVTMFVL
jgi:hypothetical protein